MAKMVFIAHPMSGDIEGNTQKVIAICRRIHSKRIIPVFPSFTWRKYLSNDPNDLKLAQAVNKEYFRRKAIDEIWFYGDRMTDGMIREARLAQKYGIKIVGKTKETRAALKKLSLIN